ncbi:integrase core domain-containing protein [Shewanella baltica]|uniref:integrase core domain-containing protein n=1 Tax=Shewanella baltica TaxID=62322 RepID=UPI0009B5AB5B
MSTFLAEWVAKYKVELKFIQYGNPQQNAYVERCNRTVRYEWLNQYLFSILPRYKSMRHYGNNERPKKQLVEYH